MNQVISMRVMFEGEVKFQGKHLWVHADFNNTKNGISVIKIRAYDMYPQSDYDEVSPTPELVEHVEEIIEQNLYDKGPL